MYVSLCVRVAVVYIHKSIPIVWHHEIYGTAKADLGYLSYGFSEDFGFFLQTKMHENTKFFGTFL